MMMLVIDDDEAGDTSLELRLPESSRSENMELKICLLRSYHRGAASLVDPCRCLRHRDSQVLAGSADAS
jgi:hypothetical protein